MIVRLESKCYESLALKKDEKGTAGNGCDGLVRAVHASAAEPSGGRVCRLILCLAPVSWDDCCTGGCGVACLGRQRLALVLRLRSQVRRIPATPPPGSPS